MHAAGVRVHGDEAAADLGDLHQRPDAGRLGRVLGRHPDHVADAEHIGDGLGSGAARARPSHLVEGDLDRLAVRHQVAVGLARRAQADHGLGALRLEHDAEAPRCQIAWDFDAAERHAPIAADVDLLQRPAPALLAIEGHQAVDQRPARQALQIGIERRPHRKPAVDAAVANRGALGAAVEAILAEIGDEGAAHVLGEVVGRIDLRAEGADVDLERRGLGLLGLLPRDVADVGHLIDDPVAPDGRLPGPAEGMIVVGRLGQGRQVGGLLDAELAQLLAEIVERRGGHAVGADAEIDLVQVELEDPVLRIGALDADGEDRLLELALELLLARQQEVLGHLLGDGRGTLGALLAVVLQVVDHGAGNAGEVEAAVLVEALVLGGQEGGNHQLGHDVDRHEDAPLAGVLGHQAAVVGVDARHDRRLVLGKAVVVRAGRARPSTRRSRPRPRPPRTAPRRRQSRSRAGSRANCAAAASFWAGRRWKDRCGSHRRQIRFCRARVIEPTGQQSTIRDGAP